MKGWIEIFRSGTHRASNGVEKRWTTSDLDRMVKNFETGDHEPPLVIGHPKENGPAWGWLAKVKRQGDVLLGKFRQVAPEFAELVKAGRYKKRSISVYPDGTIRHIGFLGAQPPAVKGLKDITFSDDSTPITYEYSDEEATMTELEKLQKQLEEEQRQRREAEEKAAEKEEELLKLAGKARKEKIKSFVEQGIEKGRILPAWKEMGLEDFMENLEGDEEAFEFAEGKKQTKAEWFREFLNGLAEHPLFREMTKPDEKQADSEFAEDEKLAEEMAAGHRIDG